MKNERKSYCSQYTLNLVQRKGYFAHGSTAGRQNYLDRISAFRKEKIKMFNGDEADIRQLLTYTTSTRLRSLIGDSQIVVTVIKSIENHKIFSNNQAFAGKIK